MIEKSYTDEEIAEIVRKHALPRYPKLALYREKLSRKAKADQKLNVILKGWSNYFNGGYPNPRYLRVNDYVRKRLIILSKHTSQRRYKLKYAQSYYYEWKAMGLYEMRKRRAP